MKLSKHTLGLAALIGANMIWGAAPPIFKWSLQGIDPFALAFLRFFLGSLILLPFVIHKLKITPHDFVKLLFLAFIGITLHIGAFFLGLLSSASINSSIIASSAPIFLVLAAVLLFKEPVKPKVISGMFLSLSGVLIIILRPVFDAGLDGSIKGNLLFVVATVCFVVYTIVLKEMVKKLDLFVILFYVFFFGSIMFLPGVFFEMQDGTVIQSITTQGIVGIIFGALFSSVLANIFYTYAVKNIQTDEVGLFLYLDPVVAVLVAVPLLQEVITTSFLLGSLLVFSGLYIAEGRIHYHPLHMLRGK